jgi:hypothetical protein
MPLVVEFGVQTSYNRRIYYTTALNGTLSLDNGRSLSVLFKTNNSIATAGSKYSTLKDVQGEFYLSLPAGSYFVSVNERVFDQKFKPLEFSKSTDLIHNNSINLIFEIIQRKRQINIRKSE